MIESLARRRGSSFLLWGLLSFFHPERGAFCLEFRHPWRPRNLQTQKQKLLRRISQFLKRYKLSPLDVLDLVQRYSQFRCRENLDYLLHTVVQNFLLGEAKSTTNLLFPRQAGGGNTRPHQGKQQATPTSSHKVHLLSSCGNLPNLNLQTGWFPLIIWQRAFTGQFSEFQSPPYSYSSTHKTGLVTNRNQSQVTFCDP